MCAIVPVFRTVLTYVVISADPWLTSNSSVPSEINLIYPQARGTFSMPINPIFIGNANS